MSTALVLARPERRRILLELLSQPEPWNGAQRALYRDMLHAEFIDCLSFSDDDLAEGIEKRFFCELVLKGTRTEEARELAAETARESIANLKNETSPGRKERKRRRAFREAVTHFQGGIAVTTGLVDKCIVCGGELQGRQDSAYCRNACRQAAYRKRKLKSIPVNLDVEKKSQRWREMLEVLAKHGISPKQAARWKRLAEIPEHEIDGLLARLRNEDPAAQILALHRESAL